MSSGERKYRLLKAISNPKNQEYRNYFDNPLLLSMFILTFENHPEVPKRRSVFYSNVFDTLYSKHDGITKNSFARQRNSGLERSDFQEIICLFSALTFSSGKYIFSEKEIIKKIELIGNSKSNFNFNPQRVLRDLEVSISILIKDGNEFTFPHRSMQEYFAALCVKEYLKVDNNKEEYITKLIKKSKYSSTERFKNFWYLLKEIDRRSFNTHYLIPILKRLNDKFSRYKSGKVELGEKGMMELLKYLEFGFYFIDITKQNKNLLTKEEKEETLSNRSSNYRKFAIRHINNIYWDAIELSGLDTTTLILKYFNKIGHLIKTRRHVENFRVKKYASNKLFSLSQVYDDRLFSIFEEIRINELLSLAVQVILKKYDEVMTENLDDSNEIGNILGLSQ
ncbi:MAG: hypothetical protein AAFY76_01580 [Cyanobacteria bacterium J06649_11]